jgi:hypothetical protein
MPWRPGSAGGMVLVTAGSIPVEARPERESPRPGPPDSVGHISHHTAPDLHGCHAQAHSAHVFLARGFHRRVVWVAC